MRDTILLKEAAELPPEAIQPAAAIPELTAPAPRPKVAIPFFKEEEEGACPTAVNPRPGFPGTGTGTATTVK